MALSWYGLQIDLFDDIQGMRRQIPVIFGS